MIKNDLGDEINISSDEEETNKFDIPKGYQNKVKNPKISHFNKYSFFIYDNYETKNYLDSFANKDLIKLNDKEENFLLEFINNIKHKKDIMKGKIFVSVDKKIYSELNNIFETNINFSDVEEFLLNEYNNLENRANFTCRKLARAYQEKTGKKISQTSINIILKNNYGLIYRKTTIKTNKILYDKNVLISLCFIKIVVRALRQGFSLIYWDESSLQTFNSNIKIWNKKNETLAIKLPKREKYNLLLAIDDQGVIYYEINYRKHKWKNVYKLYAKFEKRTR